MVTGQTGSRSSGSGTSVTSMTELREWDHTGARFERVSLRSATFTQVFQCLRIVLNAEWGHRLYAERDLT